MQKFIRHYLRTLSTQNPPSVPSAQWPLHICGQRQTCFTCQNKLFDLTTCDLIYPWPEL